MKEICLSETKFFKFCGPFLSMKLRMLIAQFRFLNFFHLNSLFLLWNY